MGKIFENNNAAIFGDIVSKFEYSHEVFGEKFYMTYVSVVRLSGTADIVPVMVSERLFDVSRDRVGQAVRIFGQVRSFNKYVGDKRKLILCIFARIFGIVDRFGIEKTNDENDIFLDGYICKEPIYRNTPLGREITDLLIAVNRNYGKSDYIPCIVWGRNAGFSGNLSVGTHVCIKGRFQSREYHKKIGEDKIETKIAYEISAHQIKVIEGKEE